MLRCMVVDPVSDSDIRVSDAPTVWMEAFDDVILVITNLGANGLEIFQGHDWNRLNTICESHPDQIPASDVLKNRGHMWEALSRVRVIRSDEFFENRPSFRLCRLVEFADELSSVGPSDPGVSVGCIRCAGRRQLTLVGRHRLREAVNLSVRIFIEESVKRVKCDSFRPSIRPFGGRLVFSVR